MGLFDFIFKKEKKESSETKINPYVDPIQEYVRESIEDLKKHGPLSNKSLETEAIYLASYIYMKDLCHDIRLDYLAPGLLDNIPSLDLDTSNQVLKHMITYGEGLFDDSDILFCENAYKMNMQALKEEYIPYIKNYFQRAHKIGDENNYKCFKSPLNCLWKNGEKLGESPTFREIYYKFEGNNFEFMIPPYNPLVSGNTRKIDSNTLRCDSSDGKRKFIFHFIGDIENDKIDYIEMYRLDKGDMVSYHRGK